MSSLEQHTAAVSRCSAIWIQDNYCQRRMDWMVYAKIHFLSRASSAGCGNLAHARRGDMNSDQLMALGGDLAPVSQAGAARLKLSFHPESATATASRHPRSSINHGWRG